MTGPTLDEYLRLLERNPALCAHGWADDDQKNYQANRKSLEASYDAFLICCEWLSQHHPQAQTEASYRPSLEVKHDIESHCGRFIPQGSVLAAAIFLDLPWGADIFRETTNRAAAND